MIDSASLFYSHTASREILIIQLSQMAIRTNYKCNSSTKHERCEALKVHLYGAL